MTSSSCLTDSQLVRILSGALSSDESEQAEDHFDKCSSCMSLFINLVKVIPGSQTSENKAISGEHSGEHGGEHSGEHGGEHRNN